MNDNLAYQEEIWTETLNNKIVLMSPRPTVNHNNVAFNIAFAFKKYLKGKPCKPFADGTDVYLTEKDRVIPDVMIVCNKDIIKRNGIHGVPDLIVEVLSHGTEKKDRGYKKDLYERCGVQEYWIVDTESRTVEVYLLKNKKYALDEVYKVFPDYVTFSPGEKETYKNEVSVSLYDDFSIPLQDIFDDLF
ncbi:Uma2 family endonuclease [bacterium 1XD42-1]|nr:Uma2 family endonuclease [bacterium 1XD42-8]RKJ62372.1 Uma2 family endonuclease [bacterium 1XD42-1]